MPEHLAASNTAPRPQTPPSLPPATEAPVRYVHVELGDGTVLACLDSALLLVDGPVCVFVASSPQNGPFGGKMIAPEREAERLLGELRTAIRERNVYRGRVISLEREQSGVKVRFHGLPRIDRDAIILGDGVSSGSSATPSPSPSTPTGSPRRVAICAAACCCTDRRSRGRR